MTAFVAPINLNLTLPFKLSPLYEPMRYKVMHGGRGGGKSHGVAEVLLDMAARNPLRILCAREVQKSMRDSVHRLLKDKVVKLGLHGFYEVLDNEIRGANGSLFLFSGPCPALNFFDQHGAASMNTGSSLSLGRAGLSEY